ncbi:uncharacterized protein K452DRAFT_296653 [Aplosporella prunicola CBS 121167]|uniref:Dicer-like protein 1 n=1 Tax=Aplosporella prunicola CBS 121167 TaxID=1176127 RepID=A0A6A6BHM7_9PEZI|nr:uncharacterized protein K452DRAFT_296653 [Aplosporella prunicola CBS 121167]KAF2143652.1 hypothetical protein K452DRAFT_296653 [Aplosporella prunicola CBS 121167]
MAPTPTEENLDEPNNNPQQVYWEESDSDDDGPTTDSAKNPSEKRREQNTLFKNWITQKAEDVTEKQVKSALMATDDENLSIRNVLAKQDTNVISDPREYQLELFERAKKENVIAVLDTGSGKTLIAVLLLQHMLDKEIEDRAAGKAPKIAFFLVDSVTLVFQQFAVLETNLDHKAERFCGAMRIDLWSKEKWLKYFTENMVIVCTAEVLCQCLMHSFISIDQINLLIFDEAHHAKKNHSYARIIKDYYLTQSDESKRPKVFGMTASPVDAKVDVLQAARELEMLLHSRIATTANLDDLRKTISRPMENVAWYARLRKPFETPLYQKLKAKFGEMEMFRSLFESSKQASSTLGAWSSDMYWLFALGEEEARKLESRQEQAYHKEKKRRPVASLDTEVKMLREAAEIVRQHTFGTPSLNADDLSSKVIKLHEWLQGYFERPSESKCIVFVERRHTARLLHHIFKHIGSPHLRPGIIVGNSSRAGDLNISFRKQVMTMIEFRKGDLNCLFATSIAEEGLDIPDCNLVVRFDLYRTMIQYVQSRGRARHKNSRYVHMLEMDNSAHRQMVAEVRQAESSMRKFCEKLPEDRKLEGNDSDLDDLVLGGRGFPTYTEPTTGAKLTYDSSLSVLAHFVACLPRQGDVTSAPMYVMSAQAGSFVCEVILPDNSPIITAIGRLSGRKAIAKRSAAFEMCIQLRRKRYLNENLLPIYAKQLPAMRNAHLALNLKKTTLYERMIKPHLWAKTGSIIPKEVYITVLDFPDGLSRPHQPLALLTRTKLPDLPGFPLFLTSGRASEVRLSGLRSRFAVSDKQLQMLNAYTLRIFRDIFNKTFEDDLSKMPYWVAPVVPHYTIVDEDFYGLSDVLDLNALEAVFSMQEHEWTPETPHAFLRNKFFIDRWDGGRRFFSVGVDLNLKATDPVPKDSVTGKRPENRTDILNYSVSLYKQSRARADATWRRDQPVIKAEQVLHRRNMLAEPAEKELCLRTKVYLCPEPLKISVLTSEAVTTSLVFPAIIHRIDEYLIALEACDLLGLDISPALALEAVTKDSDNTEEHEDQPINFRRGMGNNYERLEFMGDCFLKMATSISLFGQNPDDNEFDFHVKRMCLICNQNLFNTAKEIKLTKFIRSLAFNRRTWYPDGIRLLEGKGAKKLEDGKENNKNQVTHSLNDKTVADVCEAFIGAAYMTHNDQGSWKPENWDNAVKAVSTLVSSDMHKMQKWSEYYEAYQKPAYLSGEVTATQHDLAAKMEKEHPYHFRHPKLLNSAFMHPSYPFIWAKVPSYQRLEFLGDSLLDMVCIDYLFYRFPRKDPQWLTEHKMAMVSNKFLGALCVKIGFHRHLRFSHAQVEHQIREYVAEVQEAEREADGAMDYWTAARTPPKCLADVVEAYVGAVFVDAEYDYSEVARFFDMHIRPFFDGINMKAYDDFAGSHPTTHMHHLLAVTLGCQDYRLMAEELPAITPGMPPRCVAGLMLHGRIVADGEGASAKSAKMHASKDALEKISGLVPFDFRAKFGCTCHAETDGKGEGEWVADEVAAEGESKSSDGDERGESRD